MKKIKNKKNGRFVIFCVLISCLLLSGIKTEVRAEEGQDAETSVASGQEDTEFLGQIQEQTEKKILEEFDFSELNDNLRKLFPGEKITFQQVVETLMTGNLKETGQMLLQYGKDQIGYEFRTNRRNLVYMLLIAIIAAVFTNFSNALQNRQVSEISFYVLYLLLITMCLNSFRIAISGLEEKMEVLLDFMRLLCPGYFLSVAISSGSSSSLMFYNLVLFLIYLVEMVIFRFLIPVVNVYIMIQIMNYLLGEDMLSELAELIKKGISWILKTLLGCVIGINVIQGLLAPAIDSLKRSSLTKSLSAIPGIGNTFGSVTDVVLGTAVLIKNGIGMAGAVLLLMICLVPVLQMAIMTFFYKLAAALVQPVSDSRITGCISSVSEGYELMLQMLVTTMTLFLVTIAVVAAATN